MPPQNDFQQRITEDSNLGVSSIINVKTKPYNRKSQKLSKDSSSKVHGSSASVNLKKSFRTPVKHAHNSTKCMSLRNGVGNKDSQLKITAKRKKKNIKRLKPSSKAGMSRNGTSSTQFQQSTSSNLVELYHNVSVNESESDDSNHVVKKLASVTRSIPAVRLKMSPVVSPLHSSDLRADTQILENLNASHCKALTPIQEVTYNEASPQRIYCYSSNAKRYQLPTVASRMRKVNKCYLQTFNFRTIPFCAAKSTSASHNIGINIQQVCKQYTILGYKTKYCVTELSKTNFY